MNLEDRNKKLREQAIEMYRDDKDACRELANADMVYVCYTSEGYEGDWTTIYIKRDVNGVEQWFIDSGSHCSCNDIEWNPQLTTPFQAAQYMRFNKSAVEAIAAMVEVSGCWIHDDCRANRELAIACFAAGNTPPLPKYRAL